MPPIPGLAEAAAWTNREITTTSVIPGHLVVLGGGVVGVEMAQAWRSLGSRVTVIEAVDRLLSHEEPFAGEEVAQSLTERGIDIRIGVRATRATPCGDGAIRVDLDDGTAVSGDRLLVAVGRRPLTEDLGLETIGLEPGRSIDVDDTLRVPGHEWLYAVGDVNGQALLTHMGKYQARVAPTAYSVTSRRASRSTDRFRRASFSPTLRSRRPATRSPRHARRASRQRRSTCRRRELRERASTAATRRAPRASSSTPNASFSSARRSSARTSPISCTPPRSPSSERSRCRGSCTRSRRSRRAASCGSSSSKRTAARTPWAALAR